MVFAMGCFAVEDALIKALSTNIPVGQIISMICAGGAIAFLIWFKARGIAIWHPDFRSLQVNFRSFCDAVGSCFFVTALSLIPLTTASAVIQATPLVVALGAALFLGQGIGWRRWIAILVGFGGVLLIIRPGMEGFQGATLLAVVGMLGLAARDLATRALTVELTGVQLALHTFVVLVPTGVILMAIQGQVPVWPSGWEWSILAVTVVIGIIAYLAIVAATRTGNAGIISSFRYSRMIYALIIGYLAFGEVPDNLTLLGAAIVIAAGLFTLIREARLGRASPSQATAV